MDKGYQYTCADILNQSMSFKKVGLTGLSVSHAMSAFTVLFPSGFGFQDVFLKGWFCFDFRTFV